jgi:steroid 5-alpha reductase family enzyme
MNLSLLLIAWFVVILVMALAWWWSTLKQEADVVDFCWALSLGLIGPFCAYCGSGNPEMRLYLAIISGVWGLRLAGYLLFSRVLRSGEDGRYAKLRNFWGAQADRKFFWFFQAQAVLVMFLSYSFYLIANGPATDVGVIQRVGLLIGLIAIIGESLADWQLKRFISNPTNRGLTCRVGLWRYSRHPNYFFEWLHWCSYPLIAFYSGAVYYAFFVAIFMLLLILKFSGIPPTEKRALISRRDYQDYMNSTPLFWPWFSKKASKRCN